MIIHAGHQTSAVYDSHSPRAHRRGPGRFWRWANSTPSKASAAPGVTSREGVGRFMCAGIGCARSLPNCVRVRVRVRVGVGVGVWVGVGVGPNPNPNPNPNPDN